MKRLVLVFACIVIFCSCEVTHEEKQKQYSATFLDLFDTVTTIVGKGTDEEAFRASVEPVRAELEYYHKLFDIYHEYDGMNNLKTVNERAHIEPIKVDEALIELLEDSMRYSADMGGKFDPAMGSVLRLWHEAREDGMNDPVNAYLPDSSKLDEAARHCNMESIVIDREASTVFISDPELKIDVGAVAKGWASERVKKNAPEGLLISVGGNVVATGPKDENGTPWAIGIQSPDGSEEYLHTLEIRSGSVVTSGSYIRAYAVNGKLYHHIIDPDTLYPGELWTSVTVVCDDSGLADALSTSLFLLEREEGHKIAEHCGAEVMWVDAHGNKFYTPGFRELIRN